VTKASAEPALIDLGEVGRRGTLAGPDGTGPDDTGRDGGDGGGNDNGGAGTGGGSGFRSVLGRPMRTLPPRAWRALFVIVVVVSVGWTSVASGRSEVRLGRPLWTATAERGFGLGARTVYVQTGTGLSAYTAQTGQLRWQMPGRQMDYLTETVGDLVLVAAGPDDGRLASSADAADERVTETAVVDGATGQVLTRHRGFGIGAADEHHVMMVQVERDDCVSDPAAPVGCQTLVGVSVATGRERWRVPVPTDRWTTEVDPATRRIRRLLVMGTGGNGTVYDPVSGSAIASVTIDLDLFPDTDRRPPASVTLTPAGVLTATEAVGGMRVSLWPVGSPGVAWTTHVAGLPFGANPYFYVGPIGDVIEVVYGGRTTVLDPASGERRFSLSASNLTAVGGGRLLVEWFSPERRPMLVDAVTGVSVTTFIEATVIRFEEAGERVLLARFGSERTLFELADLHGRPVMIDEVDAVGFSCRARRELLACVEGSGTLRVWQLPRVDRW